MEEGGIRCFACRESRSVPERARGVGVKKWHLQGRFGRK